MLSVSNSPTPLRVSTQSYAVFLLSRLPAGGGQLAEPFIIDFWWSHFAYQRGITARELALRCGPVLDRFCGRHAPFGIAG